jgi:hypothetical protein
MKNVNARIAGLIITCSTGLYAQEGLIETVRAANPPTESLGLHSGEHDSWVELQQIGSKNLTVSIELPEVYRTCCKTNNMNHHPAPEWSFYEDPIENPPQNRTDRTSIARHGKEQSLSLDYRWTNETNKVDHLSLLNGTQQLAYLPKPTPEVKLFDPIHGDDVFDWMFTISTNRNTKNGAQLIAVDSEKFRSPDQSEFPEYELFITPPKHAWYEWINPELFIVQWADYWMNESQRENSTHWAENRIDETHPENARKIVFMRATF